VSARQENRSFQEPGLLHPIDAGHVAVAVQIERRGKDGIPIAAWPRQHRGYARANGTLARYEFALTLDQGDMTHGNARDVGNGIVRSGLPWERYSKITAARPILCGS